VKIGVSVGKPVGHSILVNDMQSGATSVPKNNENLLTSASIPRSSGEGARSQDGSEALGMRSQRMPLTFRFAWQKWCPRDLPEEESARTRSCAKSARPNPTELRPNQP
jgi:hypothetical protein